jgi:hypothetical protein
VKRILSAVIIVIITFLAVPLGVSAEVQVGMFGDGGNSFIWAFDTVTKTLTISGNGRDMDGVQPSLGFPFYEVQEIVFDTTQLRSIKNAGFLSVTSAIEIEIPNTVKVLDHLSFNTPDSPLRRITFEEDSVITSIPDNFCTNIALEYIKIPASVTTLGTAFTPPDTIAPNLTVEFEENSKLRTIQQNAFNQTSIKEITIPASVETIEMDAFSNCSSLETVTFEDNSLFTGEAPSEPGIFRYCRKLTTVDFGDKSALTEIQAVTFTECSKLTTVIFGDSSALTTVGSYAFSHCDLSLTTFPDTITSLGSNAFSNTNLRSFTANGNLSDINDVFLTVPDLEELTIKQDFSNFDSMIGGIYGAVSLQTIYCYYYDSDGSVSGAYAMLIDEKERMMTEVTGGNNYNVVWLDETVEIKTSYNGALIIEAQKRDGSKEIINLEDPRISEYKVKKDEAKKAFVVTGNYTDFFGTFAISLEIPITYPEQPEPVSSNMPAPPSPSFALTDFDDGENVGSIKASKKVKTVLRFNSKRLAQTESYVYEKWGTEVLGSFETAQKGGWGNIATITISLEKLGFEADEGTKLKILIFDTKTKKWYEAEAIIENGKIVIETEYSGIFAIVSEDVL